MPYHIDYKKVSIEAYKEELLNTELVPSRRLLLDAIDQNFDLFKRVGLSNVSQLLARIKNKKKTPILFK